MLLFMLFCYFVVMVLELKSCYFAIYPVLLLTFVVSVRRCAILLLTTFNSKIATRAL